MKKVIIFALTLCMLLACVAGCAPKASAASTPQMLTTVSPCVEHDYYEEVNSTGSWFTCMKCGYYYHVSDYECEEHDYYEYVGSTGSWFECNNCDDAYFVSDYEN